MPPFALLVDDVDEDDDSFSAEDVSLYYINCLLLFCFNCIITL